ncbi:hypothetical protein GB937_002894 [Aspergillus fischeri]|nr:hypothetical protein GB937_002894 [Aspergillus fischeri]
MTKTGNLYCEGNRSRSPAVAVSSPCRGSSVFYWREVYFYTYLCSVTVSELYRFCESQYFHFILDIRVVYLLRWTLMNMCVPFSLPKTPANKVQKRKNSFRNINNPQCRVSVVLDPICTPNEIEKSAFPEKATINPLAKTA